MEKILVVEDEYMINQIVTEFLKERKYEVCSVRSGEQALEVFAEETFDLILLDIMLPGIRGTDVLKKIRETSDVPIIMLTALDDEYTQLLSFSHLISDYVVKPFSPLILIKRIENVFRLNKGNPHITIGEYAIDLDGGLVKHQTEEIHLTRKEYDILVVLIRNKGKIVTREQLVYQVWSYEYHLENRILDNHIKNIRKKMPLLSIKTIKNRGYQLEVSP
ncbi:MULTISPECIES: response regulator transcription factor [Enterococcus]|uniref:Two-component system, OmpR family, response regulator Irr n=1 Tax=Candidatus Enterococcus mangumiae TaxID=2230878 RepID=A0ABZ2SX18_9ENTE|nr:MULTISPECIES: response regulator transcription factor [unclassified Enterococcus]MBO0461781.1 response regulator transcription factor [Enterococcus sp. DIV1298c]MBO0490358.1 response regulator transcription factor [Enterococcus sp. DIV1094]MBO1300367.1 response regulator transcription factor [Enterococcus sp. DIV1271a]